jgi:uncharacterized caspase-like protein
LAGEIAGRGAWALPAAARSWQIARSRRFSSFSVKWMRAAVAIFGAFLCIGLGPLPAHAEKLVALVIGNSAYRSVGELPNARNDAKSISKLLTDAKFDVVEGKSDLGVEEFRRALREFAVVSSDADVALVYFAGHGIELAGTNYLIPVDAKLARDLDAEDEVISLDRVLRTIEPARRLKLVLLDACRENPFVAKMSRLSPTRSISRGLARVEVESGNTMVAFAAKAGSTAADGEGGGNSPFTRALLAHLATPGLDVRIALGKVRDQVLKDTNRRQEPFVYGSLGGDIVALVPAGQIASTAPASTAPAGAAIVPSMQLPAGDAAAQAWQAVKDSTSRAELDDFIRRYGDTAYAGLAQARRDEISSSEMAALPPAAPPAARPKITDRLLPDVPAAIAQQVVLYEEDPNDPQGKRFSGSAIWRTEMVSPGVGKPAELGIRADIEIPDRGMSVTWTLRRNDDPSLPASHLIEVMFKLPPDFPNDGISNIPGVLLKQAEETRGTALAGIAVKVTNGYFLIGLSAAPADKERNIQLLKERPWFDIPIIYGNNRRAILSMEKGTTGERAFQEAFAAWPAEVVASASPPPAAAAPKNSLFGGYLVQITTQRSEADARAAFRNLQSKYPNLLGGQQAVIRRADLGPKGVYYRAAYGPFASAAEAERACSDLKAAGGQCLVQRDQ